MKGLIKKISFVSFYTIIFLILVISTIQVYAASELEVHAINVGQGDSIFIKLPDGKNMLIDAGLQNAGSIVNDYLQKNNVTKLDYVIGSHPHDDHLGGLSSVVDKFPINNIYLPNKSSNLKSYTELIKSINAQSLKVITAKRGVVLFNTTVDDQTLSATILSPVSNSYSNINDYSVVIKLIYGKTSILLAADAGTTVENELLELDENLKADVLKVAHHGSSQATSEKFIKAVNPSSAVLSVGLNNSYGYPAKGTIDRILANNIKLYRTDEIGNVILKSNGSIYTNNLTTKK